MKPLRYIVLFTLIFLSFKIFGQENPYNKLDSNGKKSGYWKTYLDENAMPTDSTESVFWGYKFYDEGKEPYKHFKKFKIRNTKFIFEGFIPSKGMPVPINGILKSYQIKKGKKDILLDEIIYKDGYPQKYIAHYSPSNNDDIWYINDFTKKYKNMEGSCFITTYVTYFVDAKGIKEIRYSWFRKEKNKWKIVKIESKE